MASKIEKVDADIEEAMDSYTRMCIRRSAADKVLKLIRDGVPLLDSKGNITAAWEPYMEVHYNEEMMRRSFTATPVLESLIGVFGTNGHTLLYEAGRYLNMQKGEDKALLFNALLKCGADPTMLNDRNDTVLHGIAWGDLEDYQEKCKLITWILKEHPKLRSCRNTYDETFVDNLKDRHPAERVEFTLE